MWCPVTMWEGPSVFPKYVSFHVSDDRLEYHMGWFYHAMDANATALWWEVSSSSPTLSEVSLALGRILHMGWKVIRDNGEWVVSEKKKGIVENKYHLVLLLADHSHLTLQSENLNLTLTWQGGWKSREDLAYQVGMWWRKKSWAEDVCPREAKMGT